MKIKPEIFKAYDIRGSYPKEINKKFTYLLGRALVNFLKSKVIIIGQDKRPSSKILFKALSQGVVDQGADVIDIGVVSSPIFNFAVAEYDLYDAGVMITASHLLSKFNGFKIVDGQAIPLDLQRRSAIKKLIEKEKIKKSVRRGNLIKVDLAKDYYQRIFSLVKTPLSQLNRIVQKIKFKVEYDQDADRIVFFDEKGERVSGDLIVALLTKYLLKNKKGEKIIYTINSSKIVKEEILRNSGKPVVSRVGHYFLKKKMKESNALFGGELSGHYYFRDFYFCECPDLVLLKILEIIKKERKTLRELIQPFKKYYSTGEMNFKIKNKEKKIKEIEKYFKNAKKSFLDGLNCEFKDWWFNLRPSNTEDIIKLTLEAKTKKLMGEKKKEIIRLI